MPHRTNTNLSTPPIIKDLRGLKDASDSYDTDNVYFTEEGWVYRHYKRPDKSMWWDEIISAGQVDVTDSSNNEVISTVSANVKLGTTPDADITFEVGDGKKDFEADTVEAGDGGNGGGVDPAPDDNPAVAPTADVTLTLTGSQGSNEAYTTDQGNNAPITATIGQIIDIVNNSGGHPVDIVVADQGAQVSEGTLTGAPAGNGETVRWDTTGVTAGTYYYQCTSHPAMIGTITIS